MSAVELVSATLAASRRPLSLARLRVATGLTRVQLLRCLQTLEEVGDILRDGSRWRSLGATRETPLRPLSSSTQESIRIVRREPEAHARDDSDTTADLEVHDWNAFRRLCKYYVDCLEYEGSGRPVLSVEDLDQRAAMLTVGPSWRDLARGARVVLDAKADTAKVLNAASSAGHRSQLRIAGPIALLRNRRDELHAYPVFTVPVKVERASGRTSVTSEGPARLNEAWLDAQFPKSRADQRENLLIELGLYDEEWTHEGLEVRIGEERTIEQLWHQLLRVRGGEFREIGGPDRLQFRDRLTARSSPGIYNRACLLASSESSFTAGNLAELRELAKAKDADLELTALAAFFGARDQRPDAPASRKSVTFVPEFQPLNPEQRAAVAHSFDQRVTALQGPPGTGKSTVVRHVLAAHALAGQSALFASRNHRALDAVVPRLQAIHPERPLILRLTPPKSDSQSKGDDWLSLLLDVLSRPFDATAGDRIEVNHRRLSDALECRAACESAVREHVEAAERLAAVNARRETLRREASPNALRLAEQGGPRVPLDRIRRLFAQLDQAHSGLVIRAKRAIASYCVTRLHRRELGGSRKDGDTPSCQAAELLAAAEIAACDQDIARLELAARSLPAQAALVESLAHADEKVFQATQQALVVLAESLGGRVPEHFRAQLANIRGELGRKRSGGSLHKLSPGLREAVERAFLQSLDVFPLWACSNLSVRSKIPLAPAAFDLVVIDEASQCDIPSCIPLLYRAKRALIVGDPMQLRHIGSVAQEAEDRMRDQHQLSATTFGRYRHSTNSIWEPAHAAATGYAGSSYMLKEHWRCHPAIAGYFSRLFYDGKLRVRTQEEAYPPVVRGGKRLRGIEWTHVAGGSESVSGGSRTHAPQVEAIVNEIVRVHDVGFEGTIGVVTPFRAHASRIMDATAKRVPREALQKWRFISETADGFQGDERDLILFGLVGGPGPDDTPAFYLRERNRFNVAVSRAKSLLHVFGDLNWARESGESILTALVDAYEKSQKAADSPVRTELIGPVWEPRLADAMQRAGFEFYQQYRTCGFYLDFAIIRDGLKLDIEVDGETYHRGAEGDRRTEDIRRDQTLKAAGWQVERFWVYELRENMEGCITRIRERLEK